MTNVIKKDFRFDFPMNEKVIRCNRTVTITHGILEVHCAGRFAPEVSPLDPEARYAVDISIINADGCNVTPTIEWSGRMDDVQEAARRHFAKLIEAEYSAFKLPAMQPLIDVEKVASEVRDMVRWFCRDEYAHFTEPFTATIHGTEFTMWAIALDENADIMLMDYEQRWWKLEPSDTNYSYALHHLRDHMLTTCATLVKNA